jgi:hypothetical protein
VFDAYVVIDGVTSPRWTAVRELVVTPDHVAYAASDGASWRVVVDGEPGAAAERIYRILVDGPHVAWVGRVDGQDVISLDGAPIVARARLRTEAIALSNGKLAHVDVDAGKERVVVDGKPGEPFDEVGTPVWSADGRVAYRARRGASQLVVVDQRELPGGQTVGAPVFSADGRRLAYAVRRARRWFVHADGREHELDLVLPDSLVFSDDGKRWAVIAGDLRREELFIVVEGNRRIPLPSREIYSLVASQDRDATATIRSWVRAEANR